MNTSKEGVHTFKVSCNATKCDIKNAIEKIFKVKVAKVNVHNRSGKKKVFRGRFGTTSNEKIAIVTLSEGKINFEGGI